MFPALRLSLAAALLGAALFTGAAHAASKPSGVQPGASCGNTSSAINQYCENIPTARGGSAPPGSTGSTAPTVATTLPPTAARTYQHLPAAKRKRARKLLSLPAPASSVPLTGSIAPSKSPWSLPIGVLLALVAIAALGAVAALARRRRRAE